MVRVVDAVEGNFTAAAQPVFTDRTAALMNVGTRVDPSADAVSGWRTDFLTAMGLKVADPADADVVIWSADGEAQRARVLADPAVAGWRATRNGRHVFATADLAGAIAYASPLSYPVVAEQLPVLLAKALA